jgi:hypothetical protein
MHKFFDPQIKRMAEVAYDLGATMAAENPAFCISADSHSAALFRQAVSAVLPAGVGGLENARGGVHGPTDMVVYAGTGNSVNISAGQAHIPGTNDPNQGLYYANNDGVVNLAITPNASNPLVAIVTASVNDQEYSGNPIVSNNTWGFLVTQGTAASSPAIPTVPGNSLVLATILVPANASSSASYTFVSGLAVSISGTTLVSSTNGVYIMAQPVARMHRAATNDNVNTSFTVCPFDTIDYDTYGGCTTGSSAEYTCPISGYYQVNGAWARGTYTNSIWTRIMHNGSVAAYGNTPSNGFSTLPILVSTVSDILHCSAGDTIQLEYEDWCGGNVTTSTAEFMSISHVARG